MRSSMKAARNSLGRKTLSRTNRRGHRAGRTSVQSKESLSRRMKKRIWHNWLMEENYL